MPRYLQAILLSVGLFTTTSSLAQVAPIRSSQSHWAEQNMQAGAFDQSKVWSQIKPVWKLGYGYVFVTNDGTNLYLLVDLTGDTGDDSASPDGVGNDAIELAFDVDHDGQLTPGVDAFYFARAGTGQVSKRVAAGKSKKATQTKTAALMVPRFGPSPASKNPHRAWEISIPLSELSAAPGNDLRLGVRTWSTQPQFEDSQPPDLENDFSKLMDVRLAAPLPAPIKSGQEPKSSTGPTGPMVIRTIGPDGRVEIQRPDGSRRILNNCGFTEISPTGHQSTITCAEAQPPTPPPLPTNPDNLKWLKTENDSLLAIIKSLVGNDQQAVQHYLDSEGANLTVYDRILRRTTVINQLLSPVD
jgi:hypothetical protein